jgi:hypothetical protein
MISKPFVHRIAILAFKKTRSNASEGRKKSYGRVEAIILNHLEKTHPVNSEPF